MPIGEFVHAIEQTNYERPFPYATARVSWKKSGAGPLPWTRSRPEGPHTFTTAEGEKFILHSKEFLLVPEATDPHGNPVLEEHESIRIEDANGLVADVPLSRITKIEVRLA
jgi:hypothetical protein